MSQAGGGDQPAEGGDPEYGAAGRSPHTRTHNNVIKHTRMQ